MIRLRIFLLLALLLFFLSGCLQIFHKPSIPPNKKSLPASRNNTVTSDVATEIKPSVSRPLQDTPRPAESSPDADILTAAPETSDKPTPPPSELAKSIDSPPKFPEPSQSSQAEAPPTETNKIEAPPPPPDTKKPEKAANETVAVSSLSPKKIQSLLDEALDFCQASQDFWQKGELENALEALDQAYSLILKIDKQDIKPELLQQKEDLRFLISKRILEIYASRNIVVNGKHNAIPMVINKHTQAEIDLFTKGKEKTFFIESYKRSGRYRSQIVKALKEAGLPIELSWLPLIESGFKVKAFSRARALGLWQFIPSTGYKFGLKRNVFIDERIDPDKSTKAAIAYLKQLHQIFGDWATVLAAYNCGEGRVLRVIRGQNVNYLDNFWDLYERLPRETARYVPRFFATLHILKNKEKYGLDSITIDSPLEFEIVTVSKQIHLRDVARNIDLPEKTLRDLNPELRYKILPHDRYPLRVPPGKTEVLLARLDEIPISSRPRPAYIKHRVRPGETLSVIAYRYKTSVSKIIRANNIHRRNFIVAGKVLKIPQKGTEFTYHIKKYQPPPDRHTSTHIVKSGDSLWILARRYSTNTKDIQEFNKLTTTRLHIGQFLKIPGRTPESPPDEGLKTYQVKRGDSPFKIALRYKMPLERFLRINKLTPRSTIFPGQKLFIE
ncbi:LysM peptidoglycan-binding domain-containing protein [Thermodesulfobacteriota bacterium]